MVSASGPRTRIGTVFGTGTVVNVSEVMAPNPPSVTTINRLVYPYGEEKRMQDYVTPNFKVLSSQGFIVNNRMNRRIDKRTYSSPLLTATVSHGAFPGSHVITWTGMTGLWFDDYATGPWFNFGPRHDLVAQTKKLVDEKPLQQSAAYSARNRISPIYVQSLVTFAEMHKTVDMIVNVATTLRHLRKAIISNASPAKIYEILGGKVSKAKVRPGILDPIYNRWLEYRYGWTPLVMELQGAINALHKSQVIPLRATARGKAGSSKQQTWTDTRSPMFGPGNAALGDCLLHFTQQETVECRAYAMFEASKEFQTIRDFGFTEVPLAMWELVPFSFVVDWFVPIGDWIEAVTPKLGVKIVAEGITTRRTTNLTRKVTAWQKVISLGVSYDVTGSTGLQDTRVYTEVDRQPTLSDALTIPSINVKLNVKRVLDSLALLSQTRGPRT
jgi:hypothetical protein